MFDGAGSFTSHNLFVNKIVEAMWINRVAEQFSKPFEAFELLVYPHENILFS